MSLNYAETWQKELLATIIQGTLCSPFISTNVKWLSAKTFHFTSLTTSGYKAHNRNGGWNRGTYSQEDVTFNLYHDRDIEFLVDKADVDETNKTASIQNISQKFLELQASPETDAEFFSKVSQVALAEELFVVHAESAWTPETVLGLIKDAMKAGKLRTYRQRGSLIGYVSSHVMDCLERSKDFTRNIEMTTIADGGIGIETRVTNVDNVILFEVVDDERFYTHFNFADGFVPVVGTGSAKINLLFASTEMVRNVPKINSIYFFEPGTHTQGDGYLYQNRAFSGTFVFPNGKDNAIDSVFVDIQTAIV